MASLEPRIIETGSYMLHCDFKGVNDKHTELVVGIISKFSVAIENLVLEHHIDIESDFSIWETSKPNTITSERTIKVEINEPGVDFLPDEDRNALVDSAYDAACRSIKSGLTKGGLLLQQGGTTYNGQWSYS